MFLLRDSKRYGKPHQCPTTHSLELAGQFNEQSDPGHLRISGHSNGQQLGYSYTWGFVVTHLQLNISYLSSPECLITCSWSIKLFLSLSRQHLSGYKGRWEGKLWPQWGKRPKRWPRVWPTSYRPYSSMTKDSVGSPEGYPDIQITNFNSSVKMPKPQNLEQ